MDAIMVAMVAVLLANMDGRSGAMLARMSELRGSAAPVLIAAIAAFAVNAAVSALLGAIANRSIGQGVLALFAAFALLSAVVALLWTGRGDDPADRLAQSGSAALTLRFGVSQLGDRSHFLIGALAATSGAAPWAAVGGLIGWLLAMAPFFAFGSALVDQRGMAWLRWGAAAALLIWAIISARRAFGI